MALDVQESGAEWLDRLTFDVFYNILWFLDVRGISTLASTCKTFRQVITESGSVWLRVLRVLSNEHSIAPQSLEPLRSVSDLRAAATRWPRIRAALKNHNLPLSLRVDQYGLGHGGMFNGVPPTLEPPILLPGGRWLLSSAKHGNDSYLICWDVQQKAIIPHATTQTPYFLLQPVAHMELGAGTTVERYNGSWAHVQATPESDGVTIAVSTTNQMGMRLHRIIQLRWDDHNSPPTFILRAELDNVAQYTDEGGYRSYTLDGDYLAIESYDSILMWNWKDDTICTISDAGRHEWAGRHGFWLSLQPPFLFVFPCELRRIVPIPFPSFVPRSSYTGHSTPATQPFIEIDYAGFSKPVSMNSWQPATARPHIDVLPVYVNGPDYIIHLSPADAQVTPLRYVAQPTRIFERTPLSSVNIVGPDGDALVCEPLPEDDGLDVEVYVYPQHADGYFLPAHSRIWDISELGWGEGGIFAGPVCPVSGTVLLKRLDRWGRLPGVAGVMTIAIVSLD